MFDYIRELNIVHLALSFHYHLSTFSIYHWLSFVIFNPFSHPIISSPTIKLITVLSLTVWDTLVLNQHECHGYFVHVHLFTKTYHVHRWQHPVYHMWCHNNSCDVTIKITDGWQGNNIPSNMTDSWWDHRPIVTAGREATFKIYLLISFASVSFKYNCIITFVGWKSNMDLCISYTTYHDTV